MEANFCNLLRNSIEYTVQDSRMALTIPHFFADDEPLTLEVVYRDNFYYISDKGQAVHRLISSCPFDCDWQAAVHLICGAYSTKLGIDHEVCIGISHYHHFTSYLHLLTMIANADLMADWWDKDWIRPYEEGNPPEDMAPGQDPSSFVQLIRDNIEANQRTHQIRASLGITYPPNGTHALYVIDIGHDGNAVISSFSNSYSEGAVFETHLWQHDDLVGYEEYIKGITDRYGCYVQDNDLRYSFHPDGDEDYIKALFTYIRVALLLSAISYTVTKE